MRNRFVRSGVLALWTVSAMPAVTWAQGITLTRLGTFRAEAPLDTAASEIAAYDPDSKRLFITNVHSRTMDIVSIRRAWEPTLVRSVSLAPFGAFANSIAVRNGVVAVAVEAIPKTANGRVLFFDKEGEFITSVAVGALPDMLTFTPDGRYILVANEGEPNSYGAPDSVDPEGSVSIIKVPRFIDDVTQADVRTARFTNFAAGALDPSIRIFGPGASVAQDLEPEYIAVSDDSKTAWVTLQENNAIAELDIDNGVFTRIFGLGYKDHSVPGNGFDGSDQDGVGTAGVINIANWPVSGMYLPDAIAAYKVRGQTYLVTANEGDVREWPGLVENARVSALTLDAALCGTPCALTADTNSIARLNVSTIGANTDADPAVERLLSYGARSFSIWTTDGRLVFDSGDQFEQIVAKAVPPYFNSSHASNTSFDTRSDDKGPEPEGVFVTRLWDRWYAFIALERIGGIMIYDVTDPHSPTFVEWTNNRNFGGDPEAGTAGDLGAEAAFVIPRADSPTLQPLLVVPNEVSGTTTVFTISRTDD